MEKNTEKNIEKKKEAPQKKPVKEAAPVSTNPDFKGIVRIAGKDVKGERKLGRALMVVKGIGLTMGAAVANVIKNELGIPAEKMVGDLTDLEIEKIDKILFNIHEHPLPHFLLNRRNDYTEGTDRHFIMSDLQFNSKQDVEREKRLYTWKGYRHSYGQKVRGQRTRNTGRSGMAVGVLRKSIIAAQKGGAGAEAAAKPGAAAAPAAKGAGAAAAPAAKPAEKPKVAEKPAAK
jgi:small subunit ribosomal protein S13